MNRRLIGSLLVAALIVVVNANLGPPMSDAERELQEERLERQEERHEDRD